MNKHPLYIIILLFLSSLLSYAQAPSISNVYEHYGVRQGLVQSQVMCAFQDSYGYMWFGTKGGISRFDGKSFKNYKNGAEIIGGQARCIGQYGEDVYAVYASKIYFFRPNRAFA